MSFVGNRITQLCYSSNLQMVNNARISGSKGRLTVLEQFYSPTQLQTPSELLDYPLPNPDVNVIFPNSQGLA